MSKQLKVLEQKVMVFYTVHVSDGIGVLAYNGNSATIGPFEKYMEHFYKAEIAQMAATLVNGRVKKHTQYKVVTEEIEEVNIDEQPTFSN